MADGDERPERFTDDELAFLRHVRFGELPPRITPEDRVETVETEPPSEEPHEPPVRREWA